MTGARDARSGCLEISGLSVGYGAVPVVTDIGLSPLRPGEVTSLIGPNAAGKSTLLKGLAGLLRARGRLVLGGIDLLAASVAERAGLVGFMPQSLPRAVRLTALESVVGALRAGAPPPGTVVDPERRAAEALERCGVLRIANAPLDTLSGGQRQLVSLAQAVVRAPRVLLLDEPTSALDPRHQMEVMSLARDLATEGRIVVVVLHDLGLAARWSDRVAVLSGGRLHAEGTPETVLAPDTLAAVYGVAARVERCSRGTLQVMIDGPWTGSAADADLRVD
ncbi:ABC transporter ATP-binding protein [Methylobrevis pamukkalensis]|uniref:Hemin import ATP-binding protein HmuV n=1 Tax=Methylobrevis pamukkalensis TaxID=1439726 RepID=A0A1E3H368_9HYPH|nr:ABC transporter ATP-binding protein [Methylobrevis pamukkalensis]ODN70762.1 Hemin import ATP-binding protein HmuV [Methylobrevis pamukkalensis]